MPIHEYACRKCRKSFEELILRKADEAEVRCPGCESRQVERQLSRPAAIRSGGGAPASGPGCGPVG